jgi:sugar phosphate permease
MPPTMSVLLGSVPEDLAGTASGVLHTSRQVGGALAVATFGALLSDPHRIEQGMRVSLAIATVVILLAVVAATRYTTAAHHD